MLAAIVEPGFFASRELEIGEMDRAVRGNAGSDVYIAGCWESERQQWV